MIRIRRSEDIISNIAANIIRVVVPLNSRGHSLDPADRIALLEYNAGIDITLYVIFSASPGPCGAPFDAVPGSAFVVCALGARGGGVFAPQVVEDFVAVGGVIGVLGAETDCCVLSWGDFSDCGGAGWAGEGCCQGAGEEQT